MHGQAREPRQDRKVATAATSCQCRGVPGRFVFQQKSDRLLNRQPAHLGAWGAPGPGGGMREYITGVTRRESSKELISPPI